MHGPSATVSRPELPSPVAEHPLDRLITPERARKYRQVLVRRCKRLVVVVEDCFDPHNATAIVRTCDAFGLQRVVVTTGRNAFKVNRKISQGSHHYMDLDVFPTIAEAYTRLRADGFTILVSDLAAGATVGPERLAPMLAEKPLALVFGNEGSGVSAEASAGADGFFLIPMVGFPQSLNLSVSVATSVYALRHEALSADRPGDLTPDEQTACYDRWIRRFAGDRGDMLLRQESGRHGEELDVFGAQRSDQR